MSAEDPRLTTVLPLLEKQCDVFELVAAMHQHKDVGVQDALCSKLYEAKSHEIEFFLPQLWYEARERTFFCRPHNVVVTSAVARFAGFMAEDQ